MNLADELTYRWYVDVAGPAFLRYQRLRSELKQLRPRPQRNPHLAPGFRVLPRLKELVGRHYLEGRYVNGHKPVAWVTSGAPVELLKAIGYFVIYPEKHGALCGALRKAEELCSDAEAAGYSRDICSYARTDIGVALTGKTPVGKLPKPDLLFCCTNICQTVLYWYRVLARIYDAELIVIDTPFVYDEPAPHDIEYVKEQLEEAVAVAERVAGRILDERKLRQIMQLSRDACDLWMQVMDRARTRPSPILAFDEFILMAPIVEMRGEEPTVQFYRAVLAELDDRIRKGVGAVRNERKRLLWDNLPIWYRVRQLSELFAERGFAVVGSTYTNAWGELAPLIDPTRPFESGARVYSHALLNRGTGYKLDVMRKMVTDYHADGVVLHSDRSCKPYSVGQMDQRDRLAKDIGVPALLLEADHNDPRVYSDEQATTRLTAFMEVLEG